MIYERIRNLREDKDMTQTEMSYIQTQTETYSVLLDITGDEQQAEEMRSILHLTDAQIEEAVNTVLAAKPAVVAPKRMARRTRDKLRFSRCVIGRRGEKQRR